MCIGNRLLWRCKKCFGIVLIDTRYRTSCPMAVALAARCPYEATRWTNRHLQAGTDVNPRESLRDPDGGVALLRWNEFHCVQCEVVDQVLHRVELHAGAPVLDPWNVKQQKSKKDDDVEMMEEAVPEQRWEGGSRNPSWLTPLSLWRAADDMDPALQGVPRWDFLVPVDHGGAYNGTSGGRRGTVSQFHTSAPLRELFLRGDDNGGRGGSGTAGIEGVDDDEDDDDEEGGAPLYSWGK